jgi:hypothetical protein
MTRLVEQLGSVPAEREPLYVVSTCRTSGLLEVSKNGRPIRNGQDDQEFLDFLTWNSTQGDRMLSAFKVKHNTHYFAELGRLVNHLKSTAQFIHIDRFGSNGSSRRISDGPEWEINGRYRFQNMVAAGTVKLDSELDDSAHGGRAKSGFVGVQSNIYLTRTLVATIHGALPNDRSEIRRVSSWPITRCFVYLDVSDFSKMPAGHQALVINSIVKIKETDGLWRLPVLQQVRDDLEAMMCIGDGYIFVLRDPCKAAIFGAYFAHLIEILRAKGAHPVDFHFRMGAHIGKVFTFWDPGRNDWNYIGDGINGGQRILAAVGKETDDVFVVSGQLRDEIARISPPQHHPDLLSDARNRGRHADKHGNRWRYYEINHSRLRSASEKLIP